MSGYAHVQMSKKPVLIKQTFWAYPCFSNIHLPNPFHYQGGLVFEAGRGHSLKTYNYGKRHKRKESSHPYGERL